MKNTSFNRPPICFFLNLISLLSGGASALAAVNAFYTTGEVGAKMPAGAMVAVPALAVVAFCLGMAPFRGFAVVIEYLARIEARLAQDGRHDEARAALSRAHTAASLNPAPAGRKTVTGDRFESGVSGEYFYAHDGQEVGPFGADAMRGLMRAGTIDAETQVYRRGGDGWKALTDFPELF